MKKNDKKKLKLNKLTIRNLEQVNVLVKYELKVVTSCSKSITDNLGVTRNPKYV